MGSTSEDHPAADVAADVGVVVVAAVAAAASSGHPESVAAVVGRAASVDSCTAIVVRTFPCSSFRSCRRPSAAAASACGAAAGVPGTADRPAGPDASGAGCGAEGAVAFASWSQYCSSPQKKLHKKSKLSSTD